MSYTPTPVKSIQQVSATFAGATATATATLGTAITTANSILIYQGYTVTGAASGKLDSYFKAAGTITNSTTITVTAGANVPVGTIWRGVVIEFLGNFVKSSGVGEITVGDTADTGTVTIAAVNTSKTIVAFTGARCATDLLFDTLSYVTDNATMDLTLTNTTTITGTWKHNANVGAGNTPSTKRIGYSYIELH